MKFVNLFIITLPFEIEIIKLIKDNAEFNLQMQQNSD